MVSKRGLPFRVLRFLIVLAVIFGGVALVVIWRVGAWNLVFPSQHHDTVAPAIPSDLSAPALLVFSKTNSFRHSEGIAAGAIFLESIGSKYGWGVLHTENGAVFNAEDLARFKAVVFLNASGDMLNEAQESAFQKWLQRGGGWLGIHSAGDDSHLGWQWYRDNLIGATFTAHPMGPQFQSATVLLENQEHPVLAGLPDMWQHEEEWYSWEASPRLEGFTILATVDEESYSPVQNFLGQQTDLHMGDHPVVWSNCVDQGRIVYIAMGHQASAFEQPQIQKLIDNALIWIIDGNDAFCPAS